MMVVTASPALTCRATVPPHPRSSSSGWAAMTSTRLAIRPRRDGGRLDRDVECRRGVAALGPLDGPREQVAEQALAPPQDHDALRRRAEEPEPARRGVGEPLE